MNADYKALCNGIDDNCNVVLLPYLADLLEDNGDRRTDGLRRLISGKVRPVQSPLSGQWYWVGVEGARQQAEHVPAAVFARLSGGRAVRYASAQARLYPTPSSAFLALAAAMA
jgi:hypothetical protein